MEKHSTMEKISRAMLHKKIYKNTLLQRPTPKKCFIFYVVINTNFPSTFLILHGDGLKDVYDHNNSEQEWSCSMFCHGFHITTHVILRASCCDIRLLVDRRPLIYEFYFHPLSFCYVISTSYVNVTKIKMQIQSSQEINPQQHNS
ncbi:uncharacterized protein LOC121747612 [Salvia splendens]|uniref:uncharacterized protein LOC121747612 n=1 Tax=Salvia splendens TaxID=180675 RepID=UPI001C27B3F0|nr:uncharacterized protein LOC121747612 [Salvia splendens]